MRLLFNDFCRGYNSTKKEETVVHFLCHCPSFARHRCRLFGSSFFVSLTELSSIDIKDIAGYIGISGWFFWVFQRVIVLYCAVLALINLPLFSDFGGNWSVQGLRSLVASQRAAMCAQVIFACSTSELPLRSEPEPDINWPPRSSDLTPLDFFVGATQKNLQLLTPNMCQKVVEN